MQVGPHDLSCNLGIPEQYDDPLFLQYIERISSVSRRHSIGVGVHFWGDIEQEIRWAGQGANLILHSADITLFKDSLIRDLKLFREILDEDAALQPAEEVAI